MTPRGRVLIVDDDAAIRDVIDMALTTEGYEVTRAVDGAAALEQLRSTTPDVILLDMKMPGVNGWDFAERYRRMPEPRAPIVVLTAAHDARERANEIEASDHLGKPFELQDLLRVVERFAGAAGGRKG